MVQALLEGQVAANEFVNSNPAESQQIVATAIGKLTGLRAGSCILHGLGEHRVHQRPDRLVAGRSAAHAEDVGLLDPVDLNGIYDLSMLNEVLRRGYGGDTAAMTASLRSSSHPSTARGAEPTAARISSGRPQGLRATGRTPSWPWSDISLDVQRRRVRLPGRRLRLRQVAPCSTWSPGWTGRPRAG